MRSSAQLLQERLPPQAEGMGVSWQLLPVAFWAVMGGVWVGCPDTPLGVRSLGGGTG